jgi:cytochrome d ubiquinol oxidase subunit II
MLTGVAVVIGYALLGATWLIWKTEGTNRSHAPRAACWLGSGTLVALAAVSAATPFLSYYWRRWFAVPGVLLTAQVPVLVVICAATFFWSLLARSERLPFLMALALFLLSFVGVGISVYPYAVPRAVTIWDAAAPLFLLVGALIIIPLILAYTSWAYWVFRGKAGGTGYHRWGKPYRFGSDLSGWARSGSRASSRRRQRGDAVLERLTCDRFILNCEDKT